mmetsp:Transcript_4344/g.11246  ORF Transcript_4344/g.11246 Transcript_4344/m.11246 type:complete len:707 (+) Transcript_4344:195-2315(+)
MAPDVSRSNSRVMDFDHKMPQISSDDESSYSEVEVSIESNRALTDDSSTIEEDSQSEPSLENYRSEYEALSEGEDFKESPDFTEVEETTEDFFDQISSRHQNRIFDETDNDDAPTSQKSFRSPQAIPKAKAFDADFSQVAPKKERQHSIVSEGTPPAESDDITSSSHTKSRYVSPKKSQTVSSSSNNNNNNNNNKISPSHQKPSSASNISGQHKSIKIPAIHNNKQEGDDDYLKRKIQQESNRRSKSRSRSETTNRRDNTKKVANRQKGRSRSSSKNGQQSSERSLQNSQKQTGSLGDNASYKSSSISSHPQRSDSMPPPRRIASVHTSTPSNQLTGATSRSSSSKHSNFDGSKRVSWKSDPKASFSDWTLHILYRDSDQKRRIDVYHLHRNIVGFGHRKSNYLLRDIMEVELQELIQIDFKNTVDIRKNSKNSNSKKHKGKKDTIITRLKLPNEMQARSVPMVLDFMYYTNETKQRMSADRSCNVFKVAEGLEVQALQKAIGEFYMKNLSLKNLAEFLTAATKVKADKLLTICKAKIGQMITVKRELSAMIPPKFMTDILAVSTKQLTEARAKDPNKYTDELIVSQSRYWSKAACICAAKNKSNMTPKIFSKLTSEENLPYIDVSATQQLMEMESNILGDNRRSPTQGRKEKQLTSLQRRCVESIGNDFDAFQQCFKSHEEIAESLKHLPSNILSEILMKLLMKP